MTLNKILLAIACFALAGVGLMPPASAYNLGEGFNGYSYSPLSSSNGPGAYCLYSNGRFSLGTFSRYKLQEKDCYSGSYVELPTIFYGFQYNDLPGVFRSLDGEGSIFYNAVYEQNRVRYRSLFVPSNTAFQQLVSGEEITIDRVYYAPNQLFFYNSESFKGFSLLGNLRINGAMLLSNPVLEYDNVFLINFSKKKAYSFTADFDLAYRIFLGQITVEELQSFHYSKSYRMVRSRNVKAIPSQLDSPYAFGMTSSQTYDKGWVYVEDIDGLVSVPEIKIIGKDYSVHQTFKKIDKYGNTFKSKNECVGYYADVRNYIIREDECIDKSGKDSTNYTLSNSGDPTEEYVSTNSPKMKDPGKLECLRFLRVRRNIFQKYNNRFEKLEQDSLSISAELESKKKKAVDFNPESSCGALFGSSSNSNSSNSNSSEDQEHGSAGADPTSKTPFTNWVLNNIPGANMLNEYILNPIANIGADGVISLIGKKDTIVCSGNGYSYTASDVDSDVLKLRELNSQCKSNTSCSELLEYQSLIKAKYLNCKDETFYIRNHIGDLRNDKFFGMGIVDNVVNFVAKEFNKGKNDIFPAFVCSKTSPLGGEYDKILWLLFLFLAFLFYKILR